MTYYTSFNTAMRERFGCKVYKLALDGGFTCPNRDGTLGTRGCIFCSGGSGDFAVPLAPGLDAALAQAKEKVLAKNPGGKFIAYFQSYTNTYAPAEQLRAMFTPVLSRPDIAALSIGTRPDCLEDDKIALLAELNKIKPVWVELGLQTVKEETARFIRRGYELPVYDDAVKRLKAAGLEVIVHMILGLPGETEEDMYRTAQYISDSGADGIKLQLLHVLRGTDLYALYEQGAFRTMEQEEYLRVLEGCVKRLRPGLVVHRLTGDGAKKDLAAPLWTADKKKVINAVRAVLQPLGGNA